ncbi:MAG: hypothetical protein HN601_09705 [Candidatus Marinimicrobia bacterium]|mgnify:CR=1 FL=1|nr:hypothetical protein [Candidatus Neomarinimicrobiota bacterium]
MKISFWSESQIAGKIQRDFENARTEYGWMIALDAQHHNLTTLPLFHHIEHYDLGIVIIPKNNPNVDLTKVKRVCDKVAVMQEGPAQYFTDYSLENQIHFYNNLVEADLLFCHNESDVSFYKGLTDKPVYVMSSLMILDSVSNLPKVNRSGVIVGGNFCAWYNGFISYLQSLNFKEEIYLPSMGRKIENEEQMDGIQHLPYMTWVEWIKKLNNFKYAIHLMPTVAAGTFSLNCAYLKIPCISNEKLDTQRICFPELSVDVNDLETVNNLVVRLRDDKDFYNECSETAHDNYMKHYTEEVFLEHMNKVFGSL